MSIKGILPIDGIAKQRDIFRLAASIYSETSETFSSGETQLQLVKCMFVGKNNKYLTCSEIVANLLDMYKYHISEDEIMALIKKSRGAFQIIQRDDTEAYNLTEDSFRECIESQKNNIDSFIEKFIEQYKIEEGENCKQAIHMYLYELTTTNINSYRILMAGKDGTQFASSELSVDVVDLSAAERKIVHEFIKWDNTEKNVALGNLVYCCLEYCLLINGDSPNKLLGDFIKRREIYLDTNVIFRALGINGESRAKVVRTFLEKCKQAKLKLIITEETQREFFDTIEYYVSQIQRFPKGKTYAGAYDQITDYNIFAFYEKWKKEHISSSLKYFKTYIRSNYASLVKQYSISEVKIPRTIYETEEFKDVCNKYSVTIKRKKQEYKGIYIPEDEGYSWRDRHDAIVIRYIELLREQYDDKNDIFFVSSDKILRHWDMNRFDCKYPIVIYPSQLFLILLKTCGRSKNDYDSFVSFINIRPVSQQISPEKAHIILAGISSITEDIKAQEYLVKSVFDEEFQSIIMQSKTDDELYQKVQTISQKYVDDQLKQNEAEITALRENIQLVEHAVQNLQDEVGTSKYKLDEKQQEIERKVAEVERKKEQIAEFAEKKIRFKLVLKTYVLPAVLVILTVAFFVFIVLQFVYADKKWNYAIIFFNWIKTTTFGQLVGDFVYTIDAVIGGGLVAAIKKWMRNPFDEVAKEGLKIELIQEYIRKSKLE